MNIEWDYSYYQPWSDNEQLIDEMIAMREETLMAQNEDITMQQQNVKTSQETMDSWYGQDSSEKSWTILPLYLWTCAKQDNIGLTHYQTLTHL